MLLVEAGELRLLQQLVQLILALARHLADLLHVPLLALLLDHDAVALVLGLRG